MSTQPDRLSAALSGRYRIERELGAGGMATVYLAFDEKHDRKVAIKVLKPELAAVLGAERFVVEIKTTAAMSHPHILPLFDSGTADGFLFYVMPYIQGETIREKLNRETQFGVDEAVRIAREIADALDYAHRHGVIHRDIKPENILLHDGRAMVMDFGIALAVSAAAGGRMTETGLSLGTPHYMSPEQATAEKEITGRSDVYSLASVLYEMLSGQPPHVGGAAQQIIMKIITEQAQPVTALRKSVPANVAAAVAKALEKLPADRFDNAKAFADALGNTGFTVAGTGAQAAGGSRGRGALANWMVALVAVAAIAIGLWAGRATAPQPEAPLTQFVVELPDSVITVNRCCGPAQMLSPDGRHLVFVGVGADGTGWLYRRSLGELTATRIAGTENGTTPFFSPDGSWLAFEAAGTIKKMPMAGGPVVPIAQTGRVSGATWLDTDTIVYSQNGESRLWRVSAAGGATAVVPQRDSAALVVYPSALPGGQQVLVTIRRPSSSVESWQVGVADLATGRLDTLGLGSRAVYAEGNIFFSAADNTVNVRPYDASAGRWAGEATALVSGVSLSGGSNHEFTIARAGWLAYEIGRGGGIDVLRLIGPNGTEVLPLPGRTSSNLEDVAVAPDGSKLVLRIQALTAQNDLWMLDRRQGTLQRFTVGGGQSPAWTPDSKRVAYAVGGGIASGAGIYVHNADQGGVPQLLLKRENIYPSSWTPDGRTLLFTTSRASNAAGFAYDIGQVTVGDTTITWLMNSDFGERQPQLSPDGKRLAFTSDRSGRAEVYVVPYAGGGSSALGAPVQISTESANSPRWARDGRTLYYFVGGRIIAAALAPGAAIAVQSRTAVNSAPLDMDMNNQNSNWDVWPGDKQVLVIDVGGGEGKRRIAVIQNWKELARQQGAKP